jgi:hypothetical protein
MVLSLCLRYLPACPQETEIWVAYKQDKDACSGG